jgi:hypothetical protein
MKFFLVPAGLVMALSFGSSGHGEPVRGSHVFERRLDGLSPGSGGKQEPGTAEFKEAFRGGRRACVIVKGDHRPVVDLAVFVYDANGRLVAKDEGRGDFVTAIWYPPRDATYRIVIQSPGKDYNDCYIVVK